MWISIQCKQVMWETHGKNSGEKIKNKSEKTERESVTIQSVLNMTTYIPLWLNTMNARCMFTKYVTKNGMCTRLVMPKAGTAAVAAAPPVAVAVSSTFSNSSEKSFALIPMTKRIQTILVWDVVMAMAMPLFLHSFACVRALSHSLSLQSSFVWIFSFYN